MDIEAFNERAAIIEYDGGESRFQAETLAAQAQGKNRWEFINEIRKRNSSRQRHIGSQPIGIAKNAVPRMQRGAA